jgi:hypothetical protein
MAILSILQVLFPVFFADRIGAAAAPAGSGGGVPLVFYPLVAMGLAGCAAIVIFCLASVAVHVAH